MLGILACGYPSMRFVFGENFADVLAEIPARLQNGLRQDHTVPFEGCGDDLYVASVVLLLADSILARFERARTFGVAFQDRTGFVRVQTVCGVVVETKASSA